MMASAALAFAAGPQWATFYLGSYTTPGGSQGISVSRLNLATGEMEAVKLAAKIENPSALAFHPSGKTLYSVLEFTGGRVAAFGVAEDGSLTPKGEASFQGGGPCHLSVAPNGRTLLVAAYGGGSLATFPLAEDGSIGEPATTFQHSGKGRDPERQKQPHLHFASASPDGRFAYGVCLGTDSILGFRFEPGTSRLTAMPQSPFQVPPGSGPRHLAFSKSGEMAYGVNELNRTVTVWRRDIVTGVLTPAQTIDMGPQRTMEMGGTAAAILIHPTGKWLYATLRGPDTVSTFRIKPEGLLSRPTVTELGLKSPRGAAIDPTGGWLLVGGQEGGGVSSFRVNSSTGAPSPSGFSIPASKPTWVEFAPAPRS